MSVTAISEEMVQAALTVAVERLLALRHADGYWRGHLSSSALSTATALSALALAR